MIIIAHDRDVDGLGCHAILHRYCALNDLPTKHLFVNYDDFCRKLVEIKGVSGEEIILGDLGYSERISDCISDLEEAGSKNEVRWFDHHDWTGVKRPKNVKMNIDMTKCGAELIAAEYLPNDEIASRIASLARAQDFMEDDELAWKLYDVISSGFDKGKLAELLSQGVFWNDEVEASYIKYQNLRKTGFAYLDEHSKLYRIGEWTCLLGFSKPYLSSTIASSHLLEKNPDFVICVYPSGKLSFRRNNQEVLLRYIASLFGGGGRDAAAGGHFGAEVPEEDHIRAFDEIMERISLAFSKMEGVQ